MKKTLIALAVLGAAGVAHAQSNVTIYGIADIGYVKESGKNWAMDENLNNRIGFMGQEALGNGLSATFQLEHRFDLFDGRESGSRMFDGGANLGLKGSFGHVRLGRMNNMSVESYRQYDPFQQYSVAGMVESSLRTARQDNTIRWDSPNWNGFEMGVSYTLKNAGADKGDNDSSHNSGYGVMLKYNNGPLSLAANYDKMADSNKSYNWNLGGAYAFGPLKVMASYERAKVKDGSALDAYDDSFNVNGTQKIWLLGATYKVSPAGTIKVAYSQGKMSDGYEVGDDWVFSGKIKKWGIGYNHDLSKRTQAYVMASRTKLSGSAYDSSDEQPTIYRDSDKVNALQFGITHKF